MLQFVIDHTYHLFRSFRDVCLVQNIKYRLYLLCCMFNSNLCSKMNVYPSLAYFIDWLIKWLPDLNDPSNDFIDLLIYNTLSLILLEPTVISLCHQYRAKPASLIALCQYIPKIDLYKTKGGQVHLKYIRVY